MCRKARDNTGPTSHIQHMLARVKRHPLKKIRGPWAKKCRDHVALIGFWRTAAYLPLLLWIHLLAALVEHALLDDLVRSHQNGLRDGYTERLRGLEVDDQLELGGLFYREIAGLGPLENLVDQDGAARPQIRCVRSIAHQAADRSQFGRFEHARYSFLSDEVHDLLSVLKCQSIHD